MANFRRKKPAHRTSHRYSSRTFEKRYKVKDWWVAWICKAPAWHHIVFHRRPRRRATAAMENKILRGHDPDAAEWPLDKKPHRYYW